MLGWKKMTRKKQDETKTTEFEVEGIEEATAPAPAHKIRQPGKPFKFEMPKLEVEVPPELKEPEEHTARIWILERRARGLVAQLKRLLVGGKNTVVKKKKKKKAR
jgi:hypothetical protein